MANEKARRTDTGEPAEDVRPDEPDGGKADGGKAAADASAKAAEASAEAGADAAARGDGLDRAAEADVIAQLESQVTEHKDRMLRAMAELENVRRRAERERKEAEAYGGTRLARDLLPVYDNLERALAHADEAAREQAGSVIEGVELTRRELVSAFAKHRIEMFTPEKGEKFDPHRQQAMYEAPVPGAQPGTVIETIQSGFMIADRLLRPALVGVAKAAPEPEGEAGATEKPE